MNVVFLKALKGTANTGDVKNVTEGFARNFLFPRSIAVPATPEAVKRASALKTATETGGKKKGKALDALREALTDKAMTMSAKANEQGTLFAHIAPGQIAEKAKTQLHADIDPSWIQEKGIKTVGEHSLTLSLPGTEPIHMTLHVRPEEKR